MPERNDSYRDPDKVIVMTPEKRQEALAQIAERLSMLKAFAVAHPEVLSFALRQEFHTRLIQLDTQSREWSDADVVDFGEKLARLETRFHVENARANMPMRIRAVRAELEKISRGARFGEFGRKVENLQRQLDWALSERERDEPLPEIEYFEREIDKLKYELAQLEKTE